MPQNIFSESVPRLHGSNFDEMIAIFASHFGPFDASPVGSARGFRWKSDFWSDGTMTLISGQYHQGWTVKAVPETPEWLSILVPLHGALDVSLRHRTVEGPPGQLLLVNNHESEGFSVRGEPHLSHVLRLDWAVLARTATAILEVPLNNGLELSPVVDLERPAGRVIGGWSKQSQLV